MIQKGILVTYGRCSECRYCDTPDNSQCEVDCFCLHPVSKRDGETHHLQTHKEPFPVWCPLETVTTRGGGQ